MNLWTAFFLLLFLGWTFFAFCAGYWARGEEDLTTYLSKIMPDKPPDDPDGGTRVRR